MATGDINIGGINLSPDDLDLLSREITNRLNTTSKDPGQYELAESLSGISSLPAFRQSGSSYQLVRVLLETLKGVDGKNVQLRISSNGELQWAPEGSEAWSMLYSRSDLQGLPGKNPVFREGAAGLEYKLEGEADTAYRLLLPYSRISGPAGDHYVFRVHDGQLQTKLSQADDSAYAGLLDLSTLKGEKGDTGPAPVLELGTVATAGPSDPASAVFQPNGSDPSGAHKYRLDLSIPQGRPGVDGTGAGNVVVDNPSSLFAAKQYAFRPGQDGSVNGSFVEVEARGGATEILDLSLLFDSQGNLVNEVTDGFIAELQKAYDEKYGNCTATAFDDAVMPMILQKTGNIYSVVTSMSSTDGTELNFINYNFTINASSKSVEGYGKITRFEAAGDGTKALMDNGRYQAVPNEAPLDGKTYARKDGRWIEVKTIPEVEIVKVTLASNQTQPDNRLLGAEVTVNGNGTIQKKLWQGEQLNFIVEPGGSYEITCSDADGYITPDPITVNVGTDDSTTIFPTYVKMVEEDLSCWVIFDESQSTTILERGGNGEVREAIRAKFRRCMAMPQANGKAAIAYLNNSDSTKWPDGSISPYDTYSEGVNIMVHFPAYYYRSEELGDKRYKLYLSEVKINSSYKEEKECLVGVFEASIIRSDLGVGGISSLLHSVYDKASTGSNTINSFYEFARNNGSKWGLIDYSVHKTIAIMFAIMYGNTDISTLNSSIPCSGGTKRYDYGRTGGTLSLGNSDGLLPVNGDASYKSSSFLGLEDCYYSKWEFVQGINVIDRQWIAYDGGLLVDKNAAELTNAGFTNIRTIGGGGTTDGYITKVFHGEYADVMPIDVTSGSSATYYSDYYYQYSGNRIVLRSGASGNGAYCGVFCVAANGSSADSDEGIGSRLAFYGDIEIKTPAEWMALTPIFAP